MNSVQSNQASIPFSGFAFKGLGLLHFEYLCMDFRAVLMIMMCVISALSSFEYTYLIYSTPIMVSDPIQTGRFKQAMVYSERISGEKRSQMKTWPVRKGLGHCTMNIKPIVMGEKDIMCDTLKSACNKRENNIFFQSLHAYVFVKRALMLKKRELDVTVEKKSLLLKCMDELPYSSLRHFELVMFFCELQKEMLVRMLKLLFKIN